MTTQIIIVINNNTIYILLYFHEQCGVFIQAIKDPSGNIIKNKVPFCVVSSSDITTKYKYKCERNPTTGIDALWST